MLSEWMIEKPSDFSQNWYVVPCPKGVRLLVVANHVSFYNVILCNMLDIFDVFYIYKAAINVKKKNKNKKYFFLNC